MCGCASSIISISFSRSGSKKERKRNINMSIICGSAVKKNHIHNS